MAYTPLKGKWIDMPYMGGDYDSQIPSAMKQYGLWVADPNVNYGTAPEAGLSPYFNQETGDFWGWNNQLAANAAGGGSGLFGDFGNSTSFTDYSVDPVTGEMKKGGGTIDPSRSGLTNFMSYAMPIAMAAGAAAQAPAFMAAQGAGAAGAGGVGAAESMWPGLATAGGGGVPGGYAGAIGAGAAPSGAALSAGTLSGGLGGALGGFGDYGSLAGQLGNAMTGSPEVSYGSDPTGMGEYAGYSGGGGSATNPWVSGAQRVAGGLSSAFGGGSNTGSALGGLLGAGLGYLDAKNQPDSLTIKNEIDPRLANLWYGADGNSGLAGQANNLLQQQLGQPNPLTEAGKQISGMANTLPSYNDAVANNKALWDANPWITQQQDAITNKATQNLLQNVMPNIGSQANSMGGYGGSRQGIAQGLAMSNLNTDLAPALAGLASGAWENSQNRALSGANAQLGYGLNNQLQQAGLLGTGAGMQANGPWNAFNNMANLAGRAPGNTSQTQPLFSSPIAGAIGGGSLGSQIGGGTNWGDLFKGIGGIGDLLGGLFK